jgi:predicted AlkP superfamily pyrophosphatase or phosphodiesterase
LKKIYNESGMEVLKTTPFGNDYLAELAMRAIDKEELGKDNITDFLAVSFSSTDYVGHTFGPRSMEIQDTYLRLDLTIATFLEYLDKTVGKDNYLVFLTADHAVADNAIFLKDRKLNVDNIPSKEIFASLTKFSTETFGENLVLDYSNFNIFLNRDLIKQKGLELAKVKQSFNDFLLLQAYVKRVYTQEDILAGSAQDYYLNFIFKGYDPKQSGDLVILEAAGYLESYSATGTTHGTPNSYDTNVPLLFYGWHVPQGESSKKEYITEIAPTLSKMLKITTPNGTESQVLEELFVKK